MSRHTYANIPGRGPKNMRCAQCMFWARYLTSKTKHACLRIVERFGWEGTAPIQNAAACRDFTEKRPMQRPDLLAIGGTIRSK